MCLSCTQGICCSYMVWLGVTSLINTGSYFKYMPLGPSLRFHKFLRKLKKFTTRGYPREDHANSSFSFISIHKALITYVTLEFHIQDSWWMLPQKPTTTALATVVRSLSISGVILALHSHEGNEAAFFSNWRGMPPLRVEDSWCASKINLAAE